MRAGIPSIDLGSRRVRLDAASPAFFQDPYAAYRMLQQQCPVFFWEEYRHWCFAAYRDVNAILRDRRFGRELVGLSTDCRSGLADVPPHLTPFYAVEANSMLEREPPAHTRLRSKVHRAFLSRRVEVMRPRIEALAHELLDRLPASGSVDLLTAFCTPIPVTMICSLLGVPVEMAPRLLEWSHRMVAMYQFRRSRDDEDRAVLATREFVAFLRDLIQAVPSGPDDTLISHLVRPADDPDALSEDEVVSTCILLLNAGHEATVHALGNGIHVLLEQGGDMSRWFQSDERAEATVEELLRYRPPLHMFCRYVLEDLSWRGVDLRRGDKVGLLLAAANRDPTQFPDPDVFDPARLEKRHVSFGAGIHFCLGAPLARLEMRVALTVLFQRLPGLRLAAPPRYRDSWHFHGLEELIVSY